MKPRCSTRCYTITAAVLALIIFCWPSRFAAKYEYIKGLDIRQELVEKATKNISLSLGPKCDYEELIEENLGMYKPPFTEQVLNNYNVQPGGEFHPSDCTSRFSTAIIVPYRQREEQLNKFLVYMHNFLRRQKIHYRIFVIEQLDPKPFNRAKLLNIGAMIAMRFDFPCLVLQDVDLLPTNLGHIYACTRRPRHMCAALDKFRYNLPYNEIAGGAIAIQSRTFLTVNGFSNLFSGWGGEDDDFYARLKDKNFKICRFEPEYSRFTMLKHKQEKASENRMAMLINGHLRFHTDGLNSLVYKEASMKLHHLFTLISVET